MATLFSAFRLLKTYRNKLVSGACAYSKEFQVSGITVHLYQPLKPSRSMILMVPGLHPHGIHDLRFRALAQTLAEARFWVIAADIEEFRRFEITTNVMKLLETIFDALPECLPDLPQRNIGLLGISYASGPVFALAANRKVDFVISIGGYHNLASTLKSSLTSAEPWGRMILALNQLQDLVPNEHRAVREILLRKLNLDDEEATRLQSELNKEAKEFLQEITNGLSPDFVSIFADCIDRNSSLCQALSPETYVSKLNPEMRFYLIHGFTDPLIPYRETDELEQDLKKAGHIRVFKLITEALTHADALSGHQILESWKLLRWIQRLLSET